MAIQETDGYGKMMALIANQCIWKGKVANGSTTAADMARAEARCIGCCGVDKTCPAYIPLITTRAKTLPHDVALQAGIVAKINWQNRGS